MNKILAIIIVLSVIWIAYAQDISEYLITNDIASYKKITKGGPSGSILAGADHFRLDHQDTSYGISYVNDETKMWIEVQITQHAGADSDKWLLHEVERGFRRGDYEENMTSSRFRNINGSHIFYSGLGGGTYRWVSNNVVVNIEYTDLYKQKPEPLEVVQAYLVRFPSTIPTLTIDETHNVKWIKDEMQRRLWLCDKWFEQLQAGNIEQKRALKEVVDHMGIFLSYRDKYFGTDSEADARSLVNYRSQNNEEMIRNKLQEYKSWWSTNKDGSITLP